MNVTARNVVGGLLTAATLVLPTRGSAQPRQVAYPEVKVVLENAYKPDVASIRIWQFFSSKISPT